MKTMNAVNSVSGGVLTLAAASFALTAVAHGEVIAAEHDEKIVGNSDSSRAASDQRRRRASIEEVIVTARRRSESIQDIPLSISAITADEVSRRGLVNAEDYLRSMPGVNQVDSPTGQSIVIRGIETSPQDQNFGSGVTTATYFGETPTTNSAGLTGGTNVDIKLIDIDRVEVLRGPQGTAFGSSSMGGAVRTIPVAPKLGQFEAKVAAGYSVTSRSEDDNYNLRGVVNIPLAREKLSIRAVGYEYEDSGFYRNRARSNEGFQSAIAPFGAQAMTADRDDVGSSHVLGGRISALFQATDRLKITLNYLSQQAETNGIAQANSGSYEQTIVDVAPEHVRRGQKGGRTDMEIDIANAVVEYDFEWADLLASYSHIDSGTTYAVSDNIYGRIPPTSIAGPSDHREDVGELRFVTRFDSAWNFLIGLYGEELKDSSLFEYRWAGDLALNPTFPGTTFRGEYIDGRTLKQKAAFGEVSWEFLPGFTLTGGVRAYEYDRTLRVNTTGLFGVTSSVNEGDATGTSARGTLSYKPTDSVHLYAGFSQGFRLGKPQPGLRPDVCDSDGNGILDGTSVTLESTRQVNSDKMDNYEVGGKFTLLDRRLAIDATAFRMDWSDLPVRTIPPCGLAYVANAGAARSEGAEIQINFHATEAFRIDVGGSWLKAELTETSPAQAGFVRGARLPGSPEYNANLGFQYEFDIGRYDASLRSDSMYIGPFYGNVLQSPNTRAGDYARVDISARVRIENLSFDVFVRNVTNEDAFIYKGTVTPAGRPLVTDYYGYQLRPRTVGLQLEYVF